MLDSLYRKMLKIVNLFKKRKRTERRIKEVTDIFFDDARKFIELSSSFVDKNVDRLAPVFALQFMALSAKMLERAGEYDELVERQQKQSNEIAEQLKQLITN